MKKILILTLLLILLILSACNNEKQTGDEWGLTISCCDVTNKGLTIKIEQTGGNIKGELQTGQDFKIEKLSDGEWTLVPTNPLIDYAWNAMAYKIKSNDITEFKVEWEWLYGKLSYGKYRIIKEITDFDGPFGSKTKTYYIEFIIK